eukprot:Stramenopile-MAST_4_protein_573
MSSRRFRRVKEIASSSSEGESYESDSDSSTGRLETPPGSRNRRRMLKKRLAKARSHRQASSESEEESSSMLGTSSASSVDSSSDSDQPQRRTSVRKSMKKKKMKTRRKISNYSANSEDSEGSADTAVDIIRQGFRLLCSDEHGRLKTLDQLSMHFKETGRGGEKEIPGPEFKRTLPKLLKLMHINRVLTDQETSDILEEVDLDRDGSVSYSEFINFITYSSTKLRRIARSISATMNKRMKDSDYRKIYQQVVSEGHDYIDKSRLHQYLVKELGIVLHDGEVQHILDFLDTDGNGQVNFSEFTKFLQRQGGMFMLKEEYKHPSPVLDVKLSFGADDENTLAREGYKSSHVNLNEGTFGNKIFLWYLKQSAIESKRGMFSPKKSKWSSAKPIVEIRISKKDKDAALFADRFVCLDGSTNAGFFNWGTSSYIWVRRQDENKEEPIMDVHVTVGNAKQPGSKIYDLPCSGFRRLPHNLNEGTKGADVFLWVKQAGNGMLSTPSLRKIASFSSVSETWGAHQHGSKFDQMSHAIDRHAQETIRRKYSGRDQLTKLFKQFSSGTKKMEFKRFSDLLKHVDIDVPIVNARVLFDHFNCSRYGFKRGKPGLGSLSLEDFILFCSISEDNLNKLGVKIRKAFHRKYEEIDMESILHEEFKKLSTERGKLVLDPDKFRVFIGKLVSIRLTIDETKRFLSRLDGQNDANNVTFEEFYEFIVYGNTRLEHNNTHRVLFAGHVLHQLLQSSAGSYMGKHGTSDFVASARVAWKTLGGDISPTEIQKQMLTTEDINTKLKSLASKHSHLRDKVLLTKAELDDLMLLMHPASTKKNPGLTFDAMCNFAGIGAKSNGPVVDVVITESLKSEKSMMSEKLWPCGPGVSQDDSSVSTGRRMRSRDSDTDSLQSDDGYDTPQGTPRHAQSTNASSRTRLWVDRGGEGENPIRQLVVGPNQPHKAGVKSWDKSSKPLCRRGGNNIYLWSSSDSSSNRAGALNAFNVLMDVHYTIAPPSGNLYQLVEGANRYNVPVYAAFALPNTVVAKINFAPDGNDHDIRASLALANTKSKRKSGHSSDESDEVETASFKRKVARRKMKKNKIATGGWNEDNSSSSSTDQDDRERYDSTKDQFLLRFQLKIFKQKRKPLKLFINAHSKTDKVDYVDFCAALKLLNIRPLTKSVFKKVFRSILDQKGRFVLQEFLDMLDDNEVDLIDSDEDIMTKHEVKQYKVSNTLGAILRNIYGCLYVRNTQSEAPVPMDFSINGWVKKLRAKYKQRSQKSTRMKQFLSSMLKKELKSIECVYTSAGLQEIVSLIFNERKQKVNWDVLTQKLGSIQKKKLPTSELAGYGGAMRRIRRVLTGKQSADIYEDLWHACERYDSGSTGVISLRAFRSIAGEFGFGLSRDELRGIQRQFDTGKDGTINYERLLDEASRGVSIQPSKPHTSGEGVYFHTTDTILAEVRDSIHAAARLRGDMSDLDPQRVFEHADLAGRGTVTLAQFKQGLEHLGVILPNEAINTLAIWYDISDQGEEINYVKFCNDITGEMTQVNEDALKHKVTSWMRDAEAHGLGVYDVFGAFDTRGDSTISRYQFRKALHKLGATPTEAELRFLMEKFDQGRRGLVHFANFMSYASPAGGIDRANIESLQQRLQCKVREVSMRNGGDFDMRASFEQFDAHNTGNVSKQDFQKAVSRMGMPLTDGETSYLFSRYSRGHDSIAYEDFCKFALCDEAEMDAVAHSVQQRFSDVLSEGVDYRTCFQMFDINGTGFISRREFREACRQLGLPLSEARLHAVMERFSHFTNNQQVSYNDFFAFLSSRQRRIVVRNSGLGRFGEEAIQGYPGATLGRQTVNGNAYDGLYGPHYRATLEGAPMPSFLAPSVVEKWLETTASSADREQFANVYTSIERFREKNIAMFDHRHGTASRVVSHMPYDIRRTGARGQTWSTHPRLFDRDSSDDEIFERNRHDLSSKSNRRTNEFDTYRKTWNGYEPSSYDSEDDDNQSYRRGDKVEAKVAGWTKYYSGEVTRANSDGTYDIRFDDGERKSGVKKSQMKSKESSPSSRKSPKKASSYDSEDDDNQSYRRGDKVEAKVAGWTKYYSGEVTRANSDGTYDIRFDDGERKSGVKKSQMKSVGKNRDLGSPRRIESATEYSPGTRVEAKVAGWTRYYSGEIVKKSRDGQTYEIKFDDGERKSGVRPSQIRREGATSGGSRSSTAENTPRAQERNEGDRVEAKVRGWTKYYAGKIMRVHDDGTYDIKFDDGEIKRKVKDGEIRVPKEDKKPSRPSGGPSGGRRNPFARGGR